MRSPRVGKDVCSTCDTVTHMPKMIQVRNVPDDVHRILKARAAAAGISLSDYAKQDLEGLAGKATAEEIDARVMARPRSILSREDIVSALREARGDGFRSSTTPSWWSTSPARGSR